MADNSARYRRWCRNRPSAPPPRPAMVGPAPPPFGVAGPWPPPVATARMGAGRAGKGVCGHAYRDFAGAGTDDRVHPGAEGAGDPGPGWPAGAHPSPRLGAAAAARRDGGRRNGRRGSRAYPGRARHCGPGHRLRPEAGGQAGALRRARAGRLRVDLARMYRDGFTSRVQYLFVPAGPGAWGTWPVLAEAWRPVRGRPVAAAAAGRAGRGAGQGVGRPVG